jgi:hypothetical protein
VPVRCASRTIGKSGHMEESLASFEPNAGRIKFHEWEVKLLVGTRRRSEVYGRKSDRQDFRLFDSMEAIPLNDYSSIFRFGDECDWDCADTRGFATNWFTE